MARSMQQWFDLYGESHRHPVNKRIHWICVPTIYFSIVGLLASLPPASLPVLGRMPWASAAMAVAVLGFYLPLSRPLGIGMAIWSMGCTALARYLDAHAPWPLWAISLALFAGAWIGQFIGHGIEGKKPSFFTDLLFLLVGPAWVLAFLYRRLGIMPR